MSSMVPIHHLTIKPRVVESAVGVMIPCMASCAKVFKHTGGSVTSFFSSRLSGFRRTSSLDTSHKEAQELHALPQTQKKSHLDTIDRMLMQFKTSFISNTVRSDEDDRNKKSQDTELDELAR